LVELVARRFLRKVPARYEIVDVLLIHALPLPADARDLADVAIVQLGLLSGITRSLTGRV
jgi:hypothetical protein